MNGLKNFINSFISTLHTYDYIIFSISLALFILLLVLAILLKEKTKTSLFLVLSSFVILIAGPIGGYKYIHTTLFKNEISNLVVKKLEFSQALVIKGELTNLGKQNFKKCKIKVKAFKGSNNFFEEFVYALKPFQKMTIIKEETLDINQSIEFKMILEPFTYSKEYNISVKAACL